MPATELLVKILGDGSQLEGAFGKVSSTIEGETSKWAGSISKVGPAITGVGAAITGVGAVALKLGEPMEKARVTLEQAIANTGGSFEEFQGQIGKTVDKMAGLGFGSADTQTALEKLTVATGSPVKALNEMALVAEIAAQKHISLAAASALVIKQLAGGAKLAKEFGISIKDQAVATKDVETATKAHSAAVDALAKLQEKQGDTAKIASAKSGEGAAAAAAATKAVRDAQDNLNTAQREYATLAAGPAAKDVEAGYLAIANAAKSTRDAQQKVIDAQKALDDLARGPSADTQAKAQENVGKAQLGTQKAALALSDAQAKLKALQDSHTATARQLQDAQIAVQEATYGVDDANRSLTDSQSALNKLTSDALPGSDAMKKAQDNLADAQLGLRSAVDAQADAQKKQQDLFAESVPGSLQMQAALKKVADAQDALTAAHRSGIAAGASAVTAQISEKNSAEALAAAQAKVAETGATLKASQDELAKASNKGGVEAQEMAKLHGIAEAQAHTFGGKLLALRTHIENVAGAWAGKFAPAMVQAGPLIMGVGALMESNLIKTLISLAAQLVGTGALAISTFGSMAASAVVEAAVTAGAWIAANVAIIAATGGIALAIGLIVVGIYELVTHWRTVWGWIKDIAQDVWNFLHPIFDWIGRVALAGIRAELNVFKDAWDTVWGGIKTVIKDVWDFLKPIFDFIKGGVDVVKGAVSTIGDIGHSLHIPGFQMGGVVPGATGAPMLAVVHGGETVVPAGGVIGGGASSVTVHSHLWLDGKEIADSVTTYQIQAARRNVTTSGGLI